MTETVPSFIQGFSLSVSNPEPEVVQTAPSKGKSFTIRDWELLNFLATMKQPCQPSNSGLGAVFQMTNGAISARIKRLASLGLIEVTHFNATDTGTNNRREIRVLSVPPKPWSPQ